MASDWVERAEHLVSPVAKTVRRGLSMLPTLPWYAWAGIAAAAAVLLATRAAGAATAPELPVPDRPAGAPPLLKLGSSGPWVSYLQALLGVPQTGTFDADTDAAVRAFQTSHAPPPDGIVGPATWAALGVSGSAPSPHPGPGPSPQPQPPPQNPPAPPPAPTTGNPFGLAENRADREAQMLALIGQGSYEHQWVPLSWTKDGHAVGVLVSRRALALHDGQNRLTVNASFNTAQQVADMIGGAMLTTRMADEMWRQAGTRIGILNKSWNTDNPVTGGNLARMYEQSNDVAQHVAAKGDSGIVANEGKDWVLTCRYWNDNNPAKRHNGANFGWYPGGSKSPGLEPVIQSVGLAHERTFTDYSQYLRFVKADSLTIDGQPWDYTAALADPTVSKYIQDEGCTMPLARHPDLA